MKKIIVEAEYPRDCPYRVSFGSEGYMSIFLCGKTLKDKYILKCDCYSHNMPVFPEDCPFKDVVE